MAQGAEPLLRLEKVSKSFGPVRALTDVDLDVPRGEVTALVGDNGAGKSTLIKAIAGISPADSGQIYWDGQPVHIRHPRDPAALGVETVYQDLALADNLDIVQNMFLGREQTRVFALDEEDMERKACETLAGLRVTTVQSIRQPVASLSGGQRQSVAIAKAVLWNSKLVIMDEPTAALGVAQTRNVLDLVRRLADQGLAVLVVSHNMVDVFEVADRIAVLFLGRLADIRPTSELNTQTVVELMTTGALSGESGGTAMATTEDPQVSAVEELTEPSSDKAAMAAAPELMAQTFGEFVRAWLARVRGGDAGALPVVGGLIVISILFQSLNSKFLTAGNLVNLLIQGAVYMLLAMSEVYALLLGEIDLSTGYVAGVGGVVMAELLKQGTNWPWPVAIAVALVATAAIGAFHGTLITRIGLPSFVVTLAGLLGWQGVMLLILGQGGVVPINDKVVNDITSGQLTTVAR